jgi:hypothetical protein
MINENENIIDKRIYKPKHIYQYEKRKLSELKNNIKKKNKKEKMKKKIKKEKNKT